jgi:hypothetical protein
MPVRCSYIHITAHALASMPSMYGVYASVHAYALCLLHASALPGDSGCGSMQSVDLVGDLQEGWLMEQALPTHGGFTTVGCTLVNRLTKRSNVHQLLFNVVIASNYCGYQLKDNPSW